MAVTNHPKQLDKTPTWAQRGKLRLAHIDGGPARTAAIILLDAWDSTPGTLLETSRYSADLVDELLAKKVNAVVLTWSLGFSHEGDAPQWEIVRKLLPLLKKKKIKAIAKISLTGCFSAEMWKRVPDAEQWASRDESGATSTWNQSKQCVEMDLQNPSWREYLKFKVLAAVEAGFDGLFFDDVIALPAQSASFLNELRVAAREKRGEADALLFFTHTWLFAEINAVCNFKWSGIGRKPEWTDSAHASNLPVLKFLYEEASRDVPFASALHSGELSPKEIRLASAEVLASGGSCADLKTPAAYAEFSAEHAAAFSGSDPMGNVGVLVNDAGKCADNIFFGSTTLNTLSALIHANIQCDLIPTAHADAFDFRKYKLLSALHLRSISEPLVAALKSFMQEHGGTLLVSAETGTTDADGNTIARPELFGAQSTEARIETAVGRGKLIQFGAFRTNDDEGIAQKEIADWILPEFRNSGGAQPIEVQASDGVVALLWGKGTRRWVHVLNYRSEKSDAAIALPNCGGREMSVFSPDEEKPALTVLETGSARVSFSLGGIETYCVVAVS